MVTWNLDKNRRSLPKVNKAKTIKERKRKVKGVELMTSRLQTKHSTISTSFILVTNLTNINYISNSSNTFSI